jgi:hypothetical protein
MLTNLLRAPQNDKVSSYLRNFKEALAELRGGLTEHEVMDITEETELMIEVEDILDELHSLKTVLKDQKIVIADLNAALHEAGGSWPSTDIEMKTLENHLQHIERMEETAQKADTSVSITDMCFNY